MNAIFDSSKDGRVARVIWATDEVPAPLETSDPMINWFPAHEWFTKTGVHFGIFTWQPGSGYEMHASDTIDVIVVLSGAIELILEKGSTILRAGDCLVQRATMHGWKVVGGEPCTFAGVLIAEKKD